MRTEITPGIYFEETYLGPSHLNICNSIATSALNAAAIVTGLQWQFLVHSLIEQAHIRGNMPTYKVCITDMLRANGFLPLRKTASLRGIMEMLGDSFSAERRYIAKLRGGNYCAFVPDKDNDSYVFKGFLSDRVFYGRGWIEELWLYVPGSDNRTGISRKTKKVEMKNENDTFVAKNVNPKGKYVGDCVIRAFSAVLECSWHEALDAFAAATLYEDPVLNTVPNINITLTKFGFKRCNGIKKGNRYLDGKQLCDYLSRTCRDGERIFAYVGSTHCSAIIPTEENETCCYKVQDTWDSTRKGITEFWVYKKPFSKMLVSAGAHPQYDVGEGVFHPRFGSGTVVSCGRAGDLRVLEVDFLSVGIKKISEAWLKEQKKQ